MAGDVNTDGAVNVIDLAMIGRSYGTTLDDFLYEPNADVNNYGFIEMVNIVVVAQNYGKTDP